MRYHKKFPTEINWEAFFSQINFFTGDKPVFVENFLPNPKKYLNWNDLEFALNAPHSIFGLVGEEGYLEIPTYRDYLGEKIQDKDFIFSHINKGKVFTYLNHNLSQNPYLQSLCSEIESIFPIRADADCFGNIKHNVSFPPHLDRSPIFVFQTWGEAEWVLYDNRVTHLFSRDEVNFRLDKSLLTNPTHFFLKPGDFLYIPQRTYHQVIGGEKRLALSIGCIDKPGIDPPIRKHYEIKDKTF